MSDRLQLKPSITVSQKVMSFNEKYQAGESYADAAEPTNPSFFEDPVKVATDILKDYAGARCEASLP